VKKEISLQTCVPSPFNLYDTRLEPYRIQTHLR